MNEGPLCLDCVEKPRFGRVIGTIAAGGEVCGAEPGGCLENVLACDGDCGAVTRVSLPRAEPPKRLGHLATGPRVNCRWFPFRELNLLQTEPWPSGHTVPFRLPGLTLARAIGYPRNAENPVPSLTLIGPPSCFALRASQDKS